MKLNNFLLVVGLLFVIILAGCTSETPRGNIAAPSQDNLQTNGQQPSDAPAKASFSLGETVQTKSGLSITLTRLVRIPNCGEGNCIGAFVKVKNNGDDKELDWFTGSAILGSDGKQYDKEYLNCPNAYDLTSPLFPGAQREGFICFKDITGSADILKVVLGVGLLQQANLVYELSGSMIETATVSAELQIDSVKSSWYAGSGYFPGSGTISSVEFTIKNTGEAPLADLTFDYNITRKGNKVAQGQERSIALFSLAPGKSNESSDLLLKSIQATGEYKIEMVLKDKQGSELSRKEKSFVVTGEE